MAANAASEETITNLNPHDVLLGRGNGYNEFIGNQRFRDLTDSHRKEYNSASKFDPKQKISSDIYEQIAAKGGRFLRLVDNAKPMDSIVEEGEWHVVPVKAALEKIKQGLREKKRKKEPGPVIEDAVSHAMQQEEESSAVVQANGNKASHAYPSIQTFPTQTLPTPFPGGLPSLFLPTPFATLGPPDPRVCLFQNPPSFSSFQPNSFAHLSHNAGLPQGPPSNEKIFHFLSTMGIQAPNSSNVLESALNSSRDARISDVTQQSDTKVAALPDSSTFSSDSQADDEAVLALSALTKVGTPRFSEEQEAIEKASLTDAEHADILADTFGKQCAVTRRHHKRAKKDIDPESLSFLIRVMRCEIQKFPNEEKQALLEAMDKCDAKEFSDARLERFLRCEGLNAKLGAKRFIQYWKDRRELFGAEKWLLPMTLAGALRDDLAAIEAGIYCQLPHRDESGRQMLWLEPRRYSLTKGYSSKSLVRAYWYLIEVTSRENNEAGSGYVHVVWDRNSSIYDYPKAVCDEVTRYELSSWPVRIMSYHICGSSRFKCAIIKPIFFFLTDKRARLRTLFHAVPDSKLLDTLSEYGILKPMLPTEMGGCLNLNQSEWIETRRAIEMEEIP